MTLAMPQTGGEYYFFENYFRNMQQHLHQGLDNIEAWIGLSYNAHKLDFEWQDGAQMTWSVWTDAAHGGGGQAGHCVMYKNLESSRTTDGWYDVECDLTFSYVCQSVYTPLHTYHYHNESKVNHSRAREVCESKNQTLAMPKSKPEFDDLLEFVFTQPLSSGYFWIGLTDDVIEGVYMWEDSSPLTWSSWYDDPHTPGSYYDCVFMTLDSIQGNTSVWYDWYCGDSIYYFVCQGV